MRTTFWTRPDPATPGAANVPAEGAPVARGAGAPPDRPRIALLAVCAAVTLLSAALVPLSLPLGWDELVYASRFAPWSHGVDVPFQAPRTRGVPGLLAPVAAWSDSTVLLRGWLALLAGASLYAGFRPWLRVFPHRPWTAPLAAAGYGTLWITLFYAASAMPNHYTAMGATAATACVVRWLRGERARRLLAGAGAGIGVVTLMRPNDAVWVAGPLLLALLLLRPPGAWRVAAALVAGGAAAAVPWLVESYLRFDGVRDRLRLASAQQGDVGPQLNLAPLLTSLDGPLLCRPCTGDELFWPAALWWVALAALAVAGTRIAVRAGERTAALLALAVAGSSAVTYAFLLYYAAPRFLLTTYALALVPASLAFHALWRAARARGRAAAALVAVAVAGHVAFQLTLVDGHTEIQRGARGDWPRVAGALREAGVGPGCVLGGDSAVIPLAYWARCSPAAHSPGRTPDAVVLKNRAGPPGDDDRWRVSEVEGTYDDRWRIAVPR
ncbi:hypothetical protein [Streptomyces sp. NPDC060194]|uniref:hypothetical protein n=1 Tax=Streptomyces sp. NPDC060194 TaxID=3347069 RepID=UPI003655749B